MILPDLGQINANHTPLAVLERHLPEVLAQLNAVTSYAIVREPHARFRSGVAQYLRDYVGEPGELSEQQLLSEVQKIMGSITADPEQRDMRNTVFFRQIDYIYLNGQKAVDHVYAMTDMAAIFEKMATQHNLVLERDQVWNPTVTYRFSGSSGGLKRLKDLSRQVLPTRAYAAVRDVGIKLFTTKGAPKLEDTLANTPEVADFVTSYYAADLILYQAVCDGTVPQTCP